MDHELPIGVAPLLGGASGEHGLRLPGAGALPERRPAGRAGAGPELARRGATAGSRTG